MGFPPDFSLSWSMYSGDCHDSILRSPRRSSVIPQTMSLIAGLKWIFLPPGSANLWPSNRGAIYLLCGMLCNLGGACTCVLMWVCVHSGRGTIVNTSMQNRDASGQKLAITELGKLMLCAKKNPTWFSSTVNELGKDNGSLELGREMRTRLWKLAEAIGNMRIKCEVKEGLSLL